MSDTCPDPTKCAAVQTQVAAMEKVEKKLDENNLKQGEINVNLARVTEALDIYSSGAKKDIDSLFRLGRKNEIDLAHVEGNIGVTIATEFGNLKTSMAEEVGKLNTSQAKKLGFGDIIKIVTLVSGIVILFGGLYTLASG